MTFTATTSQTRKEIPAKPLTELSYDYLLFLSSHNYLPLEYSYYVCEYVRHERYLDIYKRCQIGHREILMKIDEEIEEIRKVLYKYLCETYTFYTRETYIIYTLDDGYRQEFNVMKYLECNLTEGAKEMIEKLKQARKDRKEEFEREKEEQEEKQKNQTKEQYYV